MRLKPTINLIVAVDAKNGIAKDNQIPWLDEPLTRPDLARFKNVTSGHYCVMGRNTYNELFKLRGHQEELLPGRTCYVVTRNFKHEVQKATPIDLYQVYNIAEFDHVFIIGGVALYAEFFSVADNIYMSKINKDYGCTSFFPKTPDDILSEFDVCHQEQKNDLLTFINYHRSDVRTFLRSTN